MSEQPRAAVRWEPVDYASWDADRCALVGLSQLCLELRAAPAAGSCRRVGDGVEFGLDGHTVVLGRVADPETVREGEVRLFDAGSDGHWVHLLVEFGDGACEVVRGRSITVTD